LRFEEFSKCVKESNFTSEVGSEAIASFESQSQLVVGELVKELRTSDEAAARKLLECGLGENIAMQ
jgi:hypothetical protein